MTQHGKNYRAARAEIDRENLYSPAEAIRKLKSFPDKKFDETVELSIRLGVDPRKPDQMVRGALSLPDCSGPAGRAAACCQRYCSKGPKPGQKETNRWSDETIPGSRRSGSS